MLDTLPSSPPLPGVVQTVAWGLRPQSFFNACRRRYGPTFTMRFFDGTDIVVLSKPEDIRALFALTADEFETGRDNADILEPFLGRRTVLALDGPEHRDERRRLQHAFRSERLDSHRQIVADATLAEMATWRAGSQVRLHDATRTITLEVILRAVFGAEEGRELRGLRDALDPFLTDSTASPLLLVRQLRRDLGRRSPWGRFVRQRAAVHREVLALVGQRRAQDDVGERTDMLSALLEGTDDDSLV